MNESERRLAAIFNQIGLEATASRPTTISRSCSCKAP